MSEASNPAVDFYHRANDLVGDARTDLFITEARLRGGRLQFADPSGMHCNAKILLFGVDGEGRTQAAAEMNFLDRLLLVEKAWARPINVVWL